MQKREVKFKVCAITIADHETTLFDSKDYSMCEQFAEDYQGDYQEIFIKKVFVRPRGSISYDTRPGSEL